MGRQARIGGRWVAALFALASVFVFVFLGGSASAGEVHVYSHSFGAGELSLSPQSGIAVDQETGVVYVVDSKHSRVAKFSESGSAEGALATVIEPTFIAVDNSSGPSKGDIYVVGEGLGAVTKLNSLGLPVAGWGTEEVGERKGRLHGLAEIAGIAVDAQGNLWVLSRNEISKIATMREFDQANAGQEAEADKTVSEFTIHVEGEPRGINGLPMFVGEIGLHGIAVGSDHLYAFRDPGGDSATLERLTLAGKADEVEPGSGSILGNRANGVTIDAVEGDVYVSEAEPSGGILLPSRPPDIQRFTSAGAPFGGASGFETFGGAHEGLREGKVIDGLKTIGELGIRSSTGTVYTVDPLASDVAVYTLEQVTPPSVTLDAPVSITHTSAELTGHINPNAVSGSSRAHEVLWRFECTPRCPEQASGHFEADGQEHTVTATVTGLEAGTSYSIALVAENRGGKGSAAQPVITASAEPGATTGVASEIVHGEATLNGTVNSNGAAATYVFEYTTKTAFQAKGFTGAQSTPVSEPLPAPAKPRPVSVRIDGLQAGVEYVYRVVATNSLGTVAGAALEFRSQIGPNPLETDCPNQALRTEAGARLPDCRAYELVSPEEKNGSIVEPYTDGLWAASDGSSVTWFTGQEASGIPSPQGAHQDFAFYLSSLSGGGWSSQRLLAPEQLGARSDLVGLTADEHYALIQTAAGGAGGAAEFEKVLEPGLYLLDTATRALSAIVSPQTGQVATARAFALDGASADDSLIFFESRLKLTSNAAPEKNNLYAWDRETGVISLAGVLPGVKGEAPAGGSFGGAYSWWGGKPNLDTGGAEEALYVSATHAISENGDAVYFTAGETGQIYVRQGLTGAKPTTVRVSVANPGVNSDPHGQQPAAFQEATPDGSQAFFLSSGKLTTNANTGPADEYNDLYRYDATAKTLVDVTPDPGGVGAQVQGLLGVAEDGRSGYLVAKGLLASTGGVEGQSNLYHFEETQGGGGFNYKFVATLASGGQDEFNWSPTANDPKRARVSKDGETVLFMSELPLTGTPTGHCIYGSSCMEAYRYSMSEESLACLSCNPTGEAAPLFGAELSTELAGTLVPENIALAGTTGTAIDGVLPANLSASGTRVFFQSSEPLLPEAINGANPRVNCTSPRTCSNVYEWETVGSGSCRTPNQAGGCLSLLSTGESGQSSTFVNASADGSSVFMITTSQLVPADQDELADMYDVREDGGLAAQHASAVEPCGSDEACRGTGPVLAPTTVTPGSTVFTGLGNFLGVSTVRASTKPQSKQCKKGFVLKHGKCVKKPKPRKKNKHSKKRSHKQRRITVKRRSGGVK